jgi:dihydrolipoamide dehydrogenase
MKTNSTEKFSKIYDLAIIGAGPGGYTAAILGARLGLNTLLIEKEKKIGGTCLLKGCIPTKFLLRVADIYSQASKAQLIGLSFNQVQINPELIYKEKQRIISLLAHGLKHTVTTAGAKIICQEAKIIDKNHIHLVSNKDNIWAKNIIIATGSIPASLPGIEVDKRYVVTTDEALELKRVPRSIGIVGAGSSGVEFAFIYSKFGSKVILIEILDRILPTMERELSSTLHKVMERQGIKIFLQSKIEEIKRDDTKLKLKILRNERERIEREVELLLLSAGRIPFTKGLGFDSFKIDMDAAGYIKVDSYMRTSISGIYAVGDVVRSPQLAHVAMAEAEVAVKHIAKKEAREIDYNIIPVCVYSSPELASVGLKAEEAKEQGIQIKEKHFYLSQNGMACIHGARQGFIKIIAEKRSNRILGVHIIGEKASELIGEAVLAIKGEFSVEQLAETIHPHPTIAESLQDAARTFDLSLT